MLAFRRLCGSLLVLALALGPAASAAHASSMAETAMDGMTASQGADQSDPERCPDCVDGSKMAGCAQTVCGMVAAILPREFVLASGTPASHVVACDRSATGITRVTDPPPPRTFALGCCTEGV